MAAPSTATGAMATVGHIRGDVPAITLEPRLTRAVTSRFAEPGQVIIGCHVPGHYAASVRATISVTA